MAREGFTKRVLIAIGGIVVAAVARGFWLDSRAELAQPDLFWSFFGFGLSGVLLGWRVGMRHDSNLARNAVGLFGALLAWRLSYFPLMVVSGWKASIGEWLVFNTLGFSVVYPTFILAMFALNLLIGVVAASAIAIPQTPQPGEGRWLNFRRLLHSPPRKLLWVIGALALPVAFLTSLSWPEDYVLFADSPWRHQPDLPPVGKIEHNAYEEILNKHAGDMSLGSLVLAGNARFTYPLVPESPWGAAMKGTLEQATRDNPLTSSKGRLDEHYLAYLAAHKRIHGGEQ